MNLEKYRRAIHNKVCLHCITLGENGRCTLTGVDRCGVELYLEEIVQVVHSIHSPRISDYVEVLRKNICSKCQNQSPDGTCSLRNEAECGLDRYFALVVEAIEEVDQKKKKEF